jgi:hypothetical protein
MGVMRTTSNLQTFLNVTGYSKKVLGVLLKVDNYPGPQTQKVLKEYQTDKKIVVDGIPGPQTWKEVIRDIQKLFNDKGLSQLALNGAKLDEDGVDGPITDTVIWYLQRIKGLTQDKKLGPVTINTLANYNQSTTNNTTTDTVMGYVGVNWTLDSQNTNYSCGPSAMQMLFSVHGIYADELWLIGVMGTKPGSGTAMENLKLGVQAVNNRFGKSFKSAVETFQSWERLQTMIKAKNPPLLRIKSFLTSGEHYELLAGIDIENNYAVLGDPSNSGKRVVSLTVLREKIRGVSGPSIFTVQ